MPDTINLKELRALATAATPGPWRLIRHTCGLDGKYSATDDWTIEGPTGYVICIEGNHTNGPTVGDPDYIAACSPNVILSLLAVVEAAQTHIDARDSVVPTDQIYASFVRSKETLADLRFALESFTKSN